MKIFILLILFSTSVYAVNGNGVGNGGDAVVCENKTVLLDFLESYIAPEKEKDPYKVAALKLKYLKESADSTYRQYAKVLSGLKERIIFKKEAKFRDIKDSFEISIPTGCEIKQVAIQQDDEFGKRKIHISTDLWQQMDPHHQAGLLVHEIIYEHFSFLGEKNSLKVRAFTKFLFSERIKGMASKDIQKELRKYKLALY